MSSTPGSRPGDTRRAAARPPVSRRPVLTDDVPTTPQPGQPGATSYSSRVLARVLDDLIRIPGTRFRVGLDPVLGLLPGLGDAAGSAIASIIFVDAVRLRVPYRVLLLMGLNLLIDALLGLIPFVGDVADAAHRANSKNLRLLERTVERGDVVHADHRTYLLGAVGIVVAIMVVVIGLAILGIWALLRVIGLV